MLKESKQLTIRAKKKYSQGGLRSLIASGFHYMGRSIDGDSDYIEKHGKNVFHYPAPGTMIQIHAAGLGDLMIVRQFGRALQKYYSEFRDPELGDVVIAGGAMKPAFDPEEGDINLWWWWSFGEFDDRPAQFLDHYINETTIEPDAILCLSDDCVKEAEQFGYDTLHLPLGTYAFEPLGFERSGLGYAGSKDHKQSQKKSQILGPFQNSEEFEWVSHFVYPEQLNLWYNQKMATFGLHKEGQRQWGMVNNRVFETLASGTPFILESHPSVNDILGFEFPYQTSSTEETVKLVKKIRNNPQDTVAEFQDYAELVRENHSYDNRVLRLFEFLC